MPLPPAKSLLSRCSWPDPRLRRAAQQVAEHAWCSGAAASGPSPSRGCLGGLPGASLVAVACARLRPPTRRSVADGPRPPNFGRIAHARFHVLGLTARATMPAPPYHPSHSPLNRFRSSCMASPEFSASARGVPGRPSRSGCQWVGRQPPSRVPPLGAAGGPARLRAYPAAFGRASPGGGAPVVTDLPRRLGYGGVRRAAFVRSRPKPMPQAKDSGTGGTGHLMKHTFDHCTHFIILAPMKWY